MRPAFADDAAFIALTQLEFDASQAPKGCNDGNTFRSILSNWVPPGVLVPDADRRLVVRIRRAPTGGKLLDVTLLDAAGTTVDQRHETFASNTECHRVLYDSAFAAAKLLGAFNKPAPPEPLECPACPAPLPRPAPPEPTVCPASPSRTQLPPRMVLSVPSVHRAYVGMGVFLGTGITPEGAVGPSGTLGFGLSPHTPRIQFEINGAWASQTLPKSITADALRVDMVPLVGSLCYSRYVFRICSGLVTTFFMAERTNLVVGNDQFRITLGANLQMGTELEIAGPVSIRIDLFARLRFVERTYGQTLVKLDELSPFVAGVAAFAVWSFE